MQNTTIFEAFLDTTYGRKILKAFLRTKKGTENPVELISSKVRMKNNSNYLEIGGGVGEKTVKIAKRFGFRTIDFLEPSKKASDIFAKNSKKLGINFRIFNSSFEKFHADIKYDLVTSIHSWYYIDLKELDKLYSIIRRGGIACIYLDRKNDIIKKMQDICEKSLGFSSNNIEDIVGYLEKRKIKYDLFCEEKKLTGLIKNGSLTKRAQIIISLVAYTRWDKIPDSVKEEIRNMLLQYNRNDTYMVKRCLITIRK